VMIVMFSLRNTASELAVNLASRSRMIFRIKFVRIERFYPRVEG
jgi:hypothetical protein